MANKSERFSIVESRFVPTANPTVIRNRLMKSGKDFIYRETKYMTTIVYDGVETIYRSRDKDSFPANKLYIFKNVRSEAQKFLRENPDWELQTTKYPVNHTNFDYDDSYGTITGTDIQSAYWIIAYKMGIISEKTYNTAQGSDWKVIRLAALAVLGRTVAYHEYKNGLKQKSPILIEPEDQRIRNLYRAVRYKCYEMMTEIAGLLGNDYEAYRTDCIYYRDTPENRKKVYDYLEEREFPYKQLIYDENE